MLTENRTWKGFFFPIYHLYQLLFGQKGLLWSSNIYPGLIKYINRKLEKVRIYTSRAASHGVGVADYHTAIYYPFQAHNRTRWNSGFKLAVILTTLLLNGKAVVTLRLGWSPRAPRNYWGCSRSSPWSENSPATSLLPWNTHTHTHISQLINITIKHWQTP